MKPSPTALRAVTDSLVPARQVAEYCVIGAPGAVGGALPPPPPPQAESSKAEATAIQSGLFMPQRIMWISLTF